MFHQKKLDNHLLPGLEPLGVPKKLKGTVIPFKFNDWEDLNKVVKKMQKTVLQLCLNLVENIFPKKNILKN